jgi:hypothetical protein
MVRAMNKDAAVADAASIRLSKLAALKKSSEACEGRRVDLRQARRAARLGVFTQASSTHPAGATVRLQVATNL